MRRVLQEEGPAWRLRARRRRRPALAFQHVSRTDRQPQKKIKASVSFHIQPMEASEWLRETSKLERSDFFHFR